MGQNKKKLKETIEIALLGCCNIQIKTSYTNNTFINII